jgi:nucleoside-diphosphate-sugar epimerase
LVVELIRHGHEVTGMTRSEAGARKLVEGGAVAELVDAFDAGAVEAAVRRSKAEVVIDQLTALPKHPSELLAALPGDARLRIEGGGNLRRAALASGARRYIQQSSGFYLRAGSGLADESEQLAIDASPAVAASARIYAELEARTLAPGPMEGVALRYGFFYGPGTWYRPEGGAADQVRRRQSPIIGEGQGVWSFVHIEDDARATVAALTSEPGKYNVVDDDPSPVSRWLPAFAQWLGAPPPPHMEEGEARDVLGEDEVYYGTKLRGASNAKARSALDFRPRPLPWLRA